MYLLISSACLNFLFEDEIGEIGSVIDSVLLNIAIISTSEIGAAETRFLINESTLLFRFMCY